MDDSNVKYHHIKYILFYPSSEDIEYNSIQSKIFLDVSRYEFKTIDLAPRTTCIKNTCMIQTELTFRNQADAEKVYSEFKALINENRVIYGLFYHTLNSHHWSPDRIEPDEVLEKVEIGTSGNLWDTFG